MGQFNQGCQYKRGFTQMDTRILGLVGASILSAGGVVSYLQVKYWADTSVWSHFAMLSG